MTAAAALAPAKTEPLATIDRLSDVLDRENRALAGGDHAAVRLLAEEKRLACRAYDELARTLNDAPAAGAPDGVLRRRLRPALDRLAEASTENRRRLSAALTAHRRLLEIVADAVRTSESAGGSYARDGAPSRRGPAAPPPRAVSFDRAL